MIVICGLALAYALVLYHVEFRSAMRELTGVDAKWIVETIFYGFVVLTLAVVFAAVIVRN